MTSKQEQENIIWFEMFHKYGPIKLAQMVNKLPSYRKYMQRWPFDGAEAPFSLDFLLPHAGEQDSTTTAVEMVEDTGPSLEVEYTSDEFNAGFKATLTKRQLRILELVEQGYKPKDIYQQLGYKNTGGVRYIKWAIRQKYYKYQAEQDG